MSCRSWSRVRVLVTVCHANVVLTTETPGCCARSGAWMR